MEIQKEKQQIFNLLVGEHPDNSGVYLVGGAVKLRPRNMEHSNLPNTGTDII